MIRAVLLMLSLIVAAACNKPSEDNCRRAIVNMRGLLGTDALPSQADIGGDIRRCKGGSTRKAVECATAATSLEQLEQCDFMKIPDKEDRCRRALDRVRALRGAGSGAAPTADEVHRCRVSATRKQIECAIDADSLDEVKECEFMTPAPSPAGSGGT